MKHFMIWMKWNKVDHVNTTKYTYFFISYVSSCCPILLYFVSRLIWLSDTGNCLLARLPSRKHEKNEHRLFLSNWSLPCMHPSIFMFHNHRLNISHCCSYIIHSSVLSYYLEQHIKLVIFFSLGRQCAICHNACINTSHCGTDSCISFHQWQHVSNS